MADVVEQAAADLVLDVVRVRALGHDPRNVLVRGVEGLGLDGHLVLVVVTHAGGVAGFDGCGVSVGILAQSGLGALVDSGGVV